MSLQLADELLRTTYNLKDMTILYILYSSGLRIAELLSVRLTGIQWRQPGQLLVREGKGRKDIKTTFLYNQVTNQRLSSIVTPLDDLVGLKKCDLVFWGVMKLAEINEK